MNNIINRQKLKFFLFSLVLFTLGTGALATEVYLDGDPTEVHFNDGDTFRVTQGPLNGMRVRLSGFNALESYGPVHTWGSWTADELFEISSKATSVAQNGQWHCAAVGGKDRFGRMIYFCDDLVVALLRQGLAHVMLMAPANTREEVLLRIQDRAIKARKGIWAKGAPSFILTSVHSIKEPGSGAKTYDRFVSTINGESIMSIHKHAYKDCEVVCSWSDLLDPKPELLRNGQDIASCMTYVTFNKRYGSNRAECL